MAEEKRGGKIQVGADKLATRHAFLDTEVFHKLKHNPANRALQLLAGHIADRRLVLHITDITLSEVSRQIAEAVEATRAEVSKARKDLNRWRHTVPDIAPMPDLGDDTARRLFAAFRKTAEVDWRVKEHKATLYPADVVFADYFKRKPPFDAAGSKEFPDAFVLHTLEAWCKANKERMYIVGKDAAMTRFAQLSEYLIGIGSIDELLASASASEEASGTASGEEFEDTEALADALVNAPEFDFYFEEALEARIHQLILIYEGDLPEGEVADFAFGGEVNSFSYQIASRTRERIGLLVGSPVLLTVDIGYEDRKFAAYDKEDDVWIGAEWETTQIEPYVGLELYLELEIASGKIASLEFIRNEYYVR